jgi:hypothetical protein
VKALHCGAYEGRGEFPEWFCGYEDAASLDVRIQGVQTSNLPKVIALFESKTIFGQFVLLSPNGSIDSVTNK